MDLVAAAPAESLPSIRCRRDHAREDVAEAALSPGLERRAVAAPPRVPARLGRRELLRVEPRDGQERDLGATQLALFVLPRPPPDQPGSLECFEPAPHAGVMAIAIREAILRALPTQRRPQAA